MKQVLHYIKEAQQPLLLLGGGVVGVDEGLLNELVHVLDMPVAYTFMGKVRMSRKGRGISNRVELARQLGCCTC
jgi:thiamine pyrophosphate-dependent acetolactate synthase large subunit-like protein